MTGHQTEARRTPPPPPPPSTRPGAATGRTRLTARLRDKRLVGLIIAAAVGLLLFGYAARNQPPFLELDVRHSYSLSVLHPGKGDGAALDREAAAVMPSTGLQVPKVNLGGAYAYGKVEVTAPASSSTAKWALILLDRASNSVLDGYATATGYQGQVAWNEHWTAQLAEHYPALKPAMTRTRLGSSTARALVFPLGVTEIGFVATHIPRHVDPGTNLPTPTVTPGEARDVAVVLALVEGDTVHWAAQMR